MGLIKSTGDHAFRDFETAGLSGSGANEPDKAEIREFVAAVDSAVALIQDGQGGGFIAAETWAALAVIVGTYVGEPAQVPATDTGTHTDPVVGGTKANAGQYRWSASPAGWKWIAAPPSQSGPVVLTTVAGTSTAYTATDPTAPTSYTDRKWIFVPHVDSGASPTLVVSPIGGAKLLRDRDGGDLPVKSLLAGVGYPIWYDGTLLRLSGSWELVSGLNNYQYAVLGVTDGRVLGGLHLDGTLYPFDDELPAKDAKNKAYSAGVARRKVFGLAGFTHADNMIVGYGQSNDQGPEAWPAITGANGPTWSDPDGMAAGTPGVVMMGTDLRPTEASTTSYIPLGGADVYNNAVAITRDGDTIMTQANQAALVLGNNKKSETLVLSAGLQLKRILDRRRFLPFGETTRRLVVAAVGVGDQSLGQLLDGNPQDGTPDYFERVPGAISKGLAISTTESRSFHVVAANITQGESDLLGATIYGNRAEFKTARAQLYDDIQARALSIVGPMQKKIAIFQVLVSHAYAREEDPDGHADYFVPNADMELADERSDVFTVGPYYGVTDKNGIANTSAHLDTNGTRQMGAKIGQVMSRVLIDGFDWQPFRPIWIERRSLFVYVGFHVPEPPIRISNVYQNGNFLDCTTKGFRVEEFGENIGITEITVVAPTILRLTLAALPRGDAVLYYACHGSINTIRGHGNICDSEGVNGDSDTETIYKYIVASGMVAQENIAALINRKYDMRNWLVPFARPCSRWEL